MRGHDRPVPDTGEAFQRPHHGLSSAEAPRRLKETGPNELAAASPPPRWRKLLAQFRDPLIYLLLGAVAASTAAWAAWAADGASGWPVDTIVILAVVLTNGILGYVQQTRAERAVEALRTMSTLAATVIRYGVPVRVPAREVVPGGAVLLLAAGEVVAADATLLSSTDLEVGEASLMGWRPDRVDRGPRPRG